MQIKILGASCAKCRKLEKIVRDLVKNKGVRIPVTKVTDYNVILEYNIFTIPALVINEEVKCAGFVPKVNEIEEWIQEGLRKEAVVD